MIAAELSLNVPLILEGVGAILFVIGMAWWRSDSPSAERPASLFVLFGIAGLGAAWWLS